MSQAAVPTLTFACWFETETFMTGFENFFDIRTLHILDASGAELFSRQYLHPLTGYDPGPVWAATSEFCPSDFLWHTHTVPLDPAWGTIRIRFRFDSGDDLFNDQAGWFIDDLDLPGVFSGAPQAVSAGSLSQHDDSSAPPAGPGQLVSADDTIVLRGTVSGPFTGLIALQVEVKPVGVPFDSVTNLHLGTGVASGTLAEVSVAGLGKADYHWRARAVSELSGIPSPPWTSFGGNADPGGIDFTINLPGSPAPSASGPATQKAKSYCAANLSRHAAAHFLPLGLALLLWLLRPGRSPSQHQEPGNPDTPS